MFGRSTGAASALLLLLMAFVVAGCGNDGTGQALEEPTEHATCDRRASDHTCLEISAAMKWLDNVDDVKDKVHDEKETCSGVSGAWTAESLACPADPDLIGCCSYQTNRGDYRECFYTGADDPMAYCDGVVHGYWQPPGF